MNRREFGITLGFGAMSLFSPSPAEAARGRCPNRKGYLILDDNYKKPKPLNLIGKSAPVFYQRNKNKRSNTYKRYMGPQDFLGKIVVLNFWADWCKPCIAEMPFFEKLYRKHDDVIVLAQENGSYGSNIDLSDYTFPILASKGKSPQNITICDSNQGMFDEYWHYPKGRINKHSGETVAEYFYGAKSLPTTFIIDKK